MSSNDSLVCRRMDRRGSECVVRACAKSNRSQMWWRVGEKECGKWMAELSLRPTDCETASAAM